VSVAVEVFGVIDAAMDFGEFCARRIGVMVVLGVVDEVLPIPDTCHRRRLTCCALARSGHSILLSISIRQRERHSSGRRQRDNREECGNRVWMKGTTHQCIDPDTANAGRGRPDEEPQQSQKDLKIVH